MSYHPAVPAPALCISIDVELLWGVWDRIPPGFASLCLSHERRVVDRLLELFQRREIRATWAIVGHLLEPRDDVPHAELPAWYAPDVVEKIHKAAPEQEIGSHSYRHIYFGDASDAEAEADLREARRVHDAHGLPFGSFVFPRNQVGHLDRLAASGVKVFRSTDAGWHVALARRDRRLGQVANFVDKLVPIPPAGIVPSDRGALTELQSSMLLMARGGVRRLIRPELLVAKARLGMRRALRRNQVFHLWFHPSNFYWETETQFSILDEILAHAQKLRAREGLAVRTMGELAA